MQELKNKLELKSLMQSRNITKENYESFTCMLAVILWELQPPWISLTSRKILKILMLTRKNHLREEIIVLWRKRKIKT